MISRLLNLEVTKNGHKLVWYLMSDKGKKYIKLSPLPFKDYFFTTKRGVGKVEVAYPELKYDISKMNKNYVFSEYKDRNEAVYKVELASPRVKNGIRQTMEKERGVLLYEADVNFIDLVLKDLGISEYVDDEFVIPTPVTEEYVKEHIPDFAPVLKAYFDFETDDRLEKRKASNYKGFAKVDTCRLLSCSIRDAQTGKKWHFCEDDERTLLLKIKKKFNDYHHLEAWNFRGFDKHYGKRFDRYKIPFNWSHWLTTDAMVIHEILNPKERMFVSLDKAGERYVEMRKIKHVDSFYQMFLKDRKLLKEYNNRDVEIMHKLEDKFGFTDIAVKLARHPLIGILPQTFIYTRKPSIQAIMRISMDHYGKRIIWKSRSDIPIDTSYVGAITLDAVAGKHRNVIGVDLASLYNNVIQTWNISPEQLVLHKKGNVIMTDDKTHHTYDRFSHEGIMPRALRIFEEGRNKIKALRKGTTGEVFETYDKIQQGLKIVLLAITGGLGARGSTAFKAGSKPTGPKSFYCWYSASDFTAHSRAILNIAIEMAELLDFEVIYGDTDGIYVKLPFKKKDYTVSEVEALMITLVDQINNEAWYYLDRWNIPDDKRKILMETQGWYDPFVLFDKKKAYFARLRYNAESGEIYKGDDIEIYAKGVHMVKTSSPQFIKDMQKHIYTMVLGDTTYAEINEYAQSQYNDLINEQVDEGLIFERKMRMFFQYKNDSSQVTLAKQLVNSGKMQEGTVMFYVVTHTKDGKMVCGPEYADINESGRVYFWDHYVKTWLNEISRLLFNKHIEVVHPDQTSLSDWF